MRFPFSPYFDLRIPNFDEGTFNQKAIKKARVKNNRAKNRNKLRKKK